MKKAVKRKVGADETGVRAVLCGHFRAFAKLAEQAGEGRPLLRGLRVAHDPTANRFVVVHGGSRVEFVLLLHDDSVPPCAEVECRRMDTAGATEQAPIAVFRFSDAGVVLQSTVAELVDEKITEAPGAWSVVAAVIWGALQA